MLDRVDVHCIWVSQAVLDLLPKDIDDIPGGEIVREPGMGVFCDNAMDMVMPLWPKPDETKVRGFLKSAMRELHKVGLVGMHDAGTFPEQLALYEEMSQTDDWTLRVYAMLECGREGRNTFCPQKSIKVTQDSGMLSVRSVKLFAGMFTSDTSSSPCFILRQNTPFVACRYPISDVTWTSQTVPLEAGAAQ